MMAFKEDGEDHRSDKRGRVGEVVAVGYNSVALRQYGGIGNGEILDKQCHLHNMSLRRHENFKKWPLGGIIVPRGTTRLSMPPHSLLLS